MKSFDWHRILFEQLPFDFVAEVALRVLVAYALVFIFLKVAGRRGIRQLSVFELVVILILGSAAGDVTFYEDVPIVPVIAVFAVLLALYRLTTYLMNCHPDFENWVDGKPITLIRDGLYDIESLARLNVSENEFFMELRQRGAEHLGQVRLAILETDGQVSIFFYETEAVKSGLSVLPPEYRPDYLHAPMDGMYACNRCGCTQMLQAQEARSCSRCANASWSIALDTRPLR